MSAGTECRCFYQAFARGSILAVATIYRPVSTPSPFQALIMLYDNALFSLRATRVAILAGDKRTQDAFVSRTEDIMRAINGCVDGQATEMAVDLKTLYGYVMTELSKARKDKTTTRIERCEEVMRELRKVWVNMEVARNSAMPLAA